MELSTCSGNTTDVDDADVQNITEQQIKMPIQNKRVTSSMADALPCHVLELISKRLKLRDYVVFRSVCRTWRKSEPRLFPQLVFTTFFGKWDIPETSSDTDPQCRYFISDPQDCVLHKCHLVEFRGRNIAGSYYGWLIMLVQRYPCKCYLFNMFTRACIQLPSLHLRGTEGPTIYISSSPTDPDCTVLVADSSMSGFMFCKIGDVGWRRVGWGYSLYISSSAVRCGDYLLSVAKLGGKFYALSFQGNLVSIDNVANPESITMLPVNRICDPGAPKRDDKFLVESDGKLLAVLLSKSGLVVFKIEVFELDLQNMAWVKVTSIGDRILFIGINCCFSISTSELGVKRGNLAYVDYCNKYSMWGVFDIEHQQGPWTGHIILGQGIRVGEGIEECQGTGMYTSCRNGLMIHNKTQSAWVSPAYSG